MSKRRQPKDGPQVTPIERAGHCYGERCIVTLPREQMLEWLISSYNLVRH